jgi:hypothetical protein
VTENEIGTAIIASAMKVHAAVGAGLLESARMRDGIVRLVNGL